jgi:hypothetical protein
MHPLTASDVLAVWERGQGLHPVDRALILLAAAQPELSWEQLARLPIGQRDSLLLALHERTFGPRLASFAECPRCGEKLELDCAGLYGQNAEKGAGEREGGLRLAKTARQPEHASGPAPADQQALISGHAIQFRLPDSFDLAAMAGCRDPQEARRLLLERCVVQAARQADGLPVAASQLPPEVVGGLAEKMVQADPGAEIALDLSCPACDHRWQIAFDIVTFFWAEMDNLAKRLLRDVHTLAHAYGWREADILALSAARRQAYLDLVGG